MYSKQSGHFHRLRILFWSGGTRTRHAQDRCSRHTAALMLAPLKSGSIRQRQIFFRPLLRRHGSTYRARWGVSVRNEEINMHCSRRARVSLSQFVVATGSQMISDIRIPILLCNCKDIRVLAKVRNSEVDAALEMQGRPCLDMQPPGS